jgi:RNA polymerase sigma-70 factor, ECF subfamily
MEATDAAEVARARDGDSDAFRALVERHSRSVFRVAFRMTGNEHDAEEVVQDTFLRAYRQLHRFESRANFSTWIYRIAVNCAVDLLRTRMRHEDRRTSDTPDGTDPLMAIASKDPDPDRLLLSAEVQDQLRSAFGGLSALERAAFTLRHFEGRSIEEIGRALGLKTNATKHSIFRAVRKLRVALEPFVTESGKAPALRTARGKA